MNQVAQNKNYSEHVRSIVTDLILTVITCGLFNLYVQYVQIRAVNSMIKQEKYSFAAWFIFTIITCGLYHIYHEYRVTTDICKCLNRSDSNEPLIHILLSVMGLSFVADAIQQSLINQYYGSNEL